MSEVNRYLGDIRLGWTLEFLDYPIKDASDQIKSETPFRFWSGDGDLTITLNDGIAKAYKGTNGIITLAAPRESSNEATRLRAVMEVSDRGIREQLTYDVGPLLVDVHWIYSKRGNTTWYDTEKSFRGRLSSPILTGAQYTINVESVISDIDRGRVVNWSDDIQQSRHPGDKGFEYLTALAEGIETRWPP